MYSVYIHINKVNGKRYVGITCREPERRWGYKGYGYRQQELFYRAIQKYGWDNFEHITLLYGLDKQEAEEKEVALIKCHRSNERAYGYNIENGGSVNEKHSDYTKQKISISNTGKLKSEKQKERQRIAMTGRTLTEETKNKIGLAQSGRKRTKQAKDNISKGKMGERNPMYGHKYTDEERQRLRKTNGKITYQYSRDSVFIKEWVSVNEASDCLGIASQNISECCNGKRKTAGGYMWKYEIIDEQENDYS